MLNKVESGLQKHHSPPCGVYECYRAKLCERSEDLWGALPPTKGETRLTDCHYG